MTVSLTDLDFLTTDTGERLLTRLAHENLSEANTLSLVTALRKDYTAEQVHAALTTARLRLKAVEKFGPDAAHMFFTADALQQASHPLTRAYRANAVNDHHVLDACCGIGADSLAFARAGKHVMGLDINPVRVAMARYNAAVLGLQNARFQMADVRDGFTEHYDTIFYDPARRDDQGRRIYDVERYIPPLSLIGEWQANCILAKLSPGVDLSQLASYRGSVEFISVNGNLKEAVLWLDSHPFNTMATLLTDSDSYHWQRESEPDGIAVSTPRNWLVEPDPALIRAGLVQDAALAFDGALLDKTIAYFTSDTEPVSPWGRTWQVLDWMPFHLKKLRAYLREQNVGTVTVKKRGSPLTPEELITRLKLKGVESRTLVLTRCQGRPIVIVCADRAV